MRFSGQAYCSSKFCRPRIEGSDRSYDVKKGPADSEVRTNEFRPNVSSLKEGWFVAAPTNIEIWTIRRIRCLCGLVLMQIQNVQWLGTATHKWRFQERLRSNLRYAEHFQAPIHGGAEMTSWYTFEVIQEAQLIASLNDSRFGIPSQVPVATCKHFSTAIKCSLTTHQPRDGLIVPAEIKAASLMIAQV